jgi:hypothetical protein
MTTTSTTGGTILTAATNAAVVVVVVVVVVAVVVVVVVVQWRFLLATFGLGLEALSHLRFLFFASCFILRLHLDDSAFFLLDCALVGFHAVGSFVCYAMQWYIVYRIDYRIMECVCCA